MSGLIASGGVGAGKVRAVTLETAVGTFLLRVQLYVKTVRKCLTQGCNTSSAKKKILKIL